MRGLQFRFPKQTTPHPRTCVCVCVCVCARARNTQHSLLFFGGNFLLSGIIPRPAAPPKPPPSLSLPSHFPSQPLAHTMAYAHASAKETKRTFAVSNALSLLLLLRACVCVCVMDGITVSSSTRVGPSPRSFGAADGIHDGAPRLRPRHHGFRLTHQQPPERGTAGELYERRHDAFPVG